MKKKVIVYDFDKTIYGGESGTNFFQYYMKKYPLEAFLFSLSYIKEVIFYLVKIIDLKKLKERFFVFLEEIPKEKLLFLNLRSQIIFLQCLWHILMAREIQRKY